MSTVAELYHAARGAEGRVLGDAIVANLPSSGARTPHADEWRVRGRSLERVLHALTDAPRRVLEVGCGNGWFSARLAEAGHTVTGLDTGAAELAQAARVFAHLPITWVLGDPWSAALAEKRYDLILFAASLQYFPDLRTLFARCREMLTSGGGILIVDSSFYPNDEAAHAARARSVAYYASIGGAEMGAYYHHHTRQALMEAAADAAMDFKPPRGILAGLIAGRHPFPIVHIRF